MMAETYNLGVSVAAKKLLNKKLAVNNQLFYTFVLQIDNSYNVE